jgi:hypothetical protein
MTGFFGVGGMGGGGLTEAVVRLIAASPMNMQTTREAGHLVRFRGVGDNDITSPYDRSCGSSCPGAGTGSAVATSSSGMAGRIRSVGM